MKKTYCNPINITYPYQFINYIGDESVNREGADPTLIEWKGIYYLFVSMTGGFFYSTDLVTWTYRKLIEDAIYDYAPDVRVVDNYMYLTASRSDEKVPIYRSKNPIHEDFEVFTEIFSYWDPHLFQDGDGRVYFYWGCSNKYPIYGIELDRQTMEPLGEKVELIFSNTQNHGFERKGTNHHYEPKTEKEKLMAQYIGTDPFIEGAWVNKFNGKYYLQYAAPATQDHIYGDGVYISDHPLGPYNYMNNNPFSYKPGGFIPGAGHGSTMQDIYGNWWHASTMVISVNHNFERRVGIFPAGFDDDGDLFCNTSYGDWPIEITESMDPWQEPSVFLLSYNKTITATSYWNGNKPQNANDEDVKTWWTAKTNSLDEWLEIDLGKTYSIHSIQVNFADNEIPFKLPEGAILKGKEYQKRFIDFNNETTNYLLEGSIDGKTYEIIADKQRVKTDLSNDFIPLEHVKQYRFIRISNIHVPYHQPASISGLRVFGTGDGCLPPQITNAEYEILSELDVMIQWEKLDNVVGYNIYWGFEEGKLYHSYMIFNDSKIMIGAINKGQPLYIRVDTFNENGITTGITKRIL